MGASAAKPDRIPLFPLENVVLLPEAAVPLHVFEPRYCQLTADALAGDRRIGMVVVRPEHAHELAGDPPVYGVGCAGLVAEHQRLADGRYHVLLHGVHRFRILSELPPQGERLYRIAETEALPEQIGDAGRAAQLRDQVIDLLQRLAERTLGADREIDAGQLRALELVRFANAVSQSVRLPTREKQGLIEAPTIAERLERLASALDFHLALLAQPGADASETVH